MDYLEAKNIVHRDLRCANLLISQSDDKWNVKISDLGLSRQIASDSVYVSTDSTFPVKVPCHFHSFETNNVLFSGHHLKSSMKDSFHTRVMFGLLAF